MRPKHGSRNLSIVLLKCALHRSPRHSPFPQQFLTCAQVELTTRAFFGPNASAILQQYDDHPPYARFGALLTDALVTCYVRHVARLISGASAGPVHLYTHMHAPSARADPTNCRHYECTHGATCHAGDNVFTFASYVRSTFLSLGFDVLSRYNGIASVSFTQYEQQLSDLVADTLVSFARDSFPSWWPVYRFDRINATVCAHYHLRVWVYDAPCAVPTQTRRCNGGGAMGSCTPAPRHITREPVISGTGSDTRCSILQRISSTSEATSIPISKSRKCFEHVWSPRKLYLTTLCQQK
jgi:hypothetical protein